MAEEFLLHNFEFLNMYVSNYMDEFKKVTYRVDPRTDRSIYESVDLLPLSKVTIQYAVVELAWWYSIRCTKFPEST